MSNLQGDYFKYPNITSVNMSLCYLQAIYRYFLARIIWNIIIPSS
jgi:hypothetical protein